MQFVIFACALALANAGYLPSVYADSEYDPHPQYSFGYGVKDAHTGDDKQHHESRDGGVVSGSYSFTEADGSRRIVHYTADDVHGFNAVVQKDNAVDAPTKYVAHAPVAQVAYSAAPAVSSSYSSQTVHKIAAPVVASEAKFAQW